MIHLGASVGLKLVGLELVGLELVELELNVCNMWGNLSRLAPKLDLR
jgi:hypothetical protein